MLRSSARQAAAAITRCAQLCVQVRGVHLLNGTGGGRGSASEREADADKKLGFRLCNDEKTLRNHIGEV